ncbi:hypothetical protein ACFLR1_04005 [Bacteroidota bacterium]
MTTNSFVQLVLVDEVRAMQKAGINVHLLAAITHGIEVCGAFLDPLPYKAKGQGRKRFNLAIDQLFKTEYNQVNQKLDLYGQLRSHISHSMLPSKYIHLVATNRDRHLTIENRVITLSIAQLCDDYFDAVALLLQKMQNGDLKQKRMELEVLKNIF